MDRLRSFLRITLLLVSIFTAFAVEKSAVAERPNVVIILAADLGDETIGANGGTSYKTPVLGAIVPRRA